MKYAFAVLMALTLLAALGCSGTLLTVAEYEELIAPEAGRYELASQQVNGAIYSVEILSDQADRFLVPTLEQVSDVFTNAISDMNAAYKALVEMELPNQFTAHRDSLLEAWRNGIAWTSILHTYTLRYLDHGEVDGSLIERASVLFSNEVTSLRQARQALEALQ